MKEGRRKRSSRDVEHREIVEADSTTCSSGDQYTRRRFINKGAQAIVATFGALPILRLAKIDVAKAAGDIPGSDKQYVDQLRQTFGDKSLADMIGTELFDVMSETETTCQCRCNCGCTCHCSCSCRCAGQTCDCLCQCSCTCDCGCRCSCSCSSQCTCSCPSGGRASTFNTSSNGFRTTNRTNAVSSSVAQNSQSVISSQQGPVGQQQTNAGADNTRQGSARVTAEVGVASTGTNSNEARIIDTKSANIATDGTSQATRSMNGFTSTTVPATDTLGLAALAIGLLGVGWQALRKHVGAQE